MTVAEHHYAPFSLTPNPMVMAGALTQRVRRAKIALLGADIPILDPVRVAEEFAMLDVMTGGRVIAGMLRGTANEYVTYATNPAESRERFEEALKLIVRAWTEPQPFGWQGRHYQYRAISIWPRPVQQPHPPIYMSGSSPESGEFAARNRLKLGFAVTTVPMASKAARYYREQAAEAGWEPTPDDVLYRLSGHVADTDEQAHGGSAPAGRRSRTTACRRSTRPWRRPSSPRATTAGTRSRSRRGSAGARLEDRIALGQLLVGSPETVLAQIRAIRAISPGILDVIFLAVAGRRRCGPSSCSDARAAPPPRL